MPKSFQRKLKTIKIYYCGIQVEGPHLTQGDPPFTPNSGFTPGTSVFTHFTSARPRYATHDVAVRNKNKIKRVTEMGKKKKFPLTNYVTALIYVNDSTHRTFCKVKKCAKSSPLNLCKSPSQNCCDQRSARNVHFFKKSSRLEHQI